MSILSHCAITQESDSRQAALLVASQVRDHVGLQNLKAVVVYAAVDHDQEVILASVREALGDIPIVGCSTGGLMGKGLFIEGGYVLGMLGIGGSAIHVTVGHVTEYQNHSEAKACDLGRVLRGGHTEPPKAVILYADPLCGADMETFARRVQAEVGCPVIGAGAGQPWGFMVQTNQYVGTQVLSHAVVGLALYGDFVAECATSTGTEPTTSSAIVTKAEGNVIVELDGRPAIQLYSEFLGDTVLTEITNETNSAVALGVELPKTTHSSDVQSPYVVRGPFMLDNARGGLVMGASIPTGTKIVFHRRSIAAALEGAEAVAQTLRKRLAQRTVRVVLGFECGARTAPLLGRAEALREQLLVQRILAPDAAWLGMLAWGELAPYNGLVTYYNYTLPLLVLAE